MDDYSRNVQPIFDAKCIACHSCYNSPCQLNLTSFEGLQRGSSTINLYDFPKLEARDPTRLYVDAHSAQEWQQKKGFFTVTGPKPQNILWYLITQPPAVQSGLQKKYDSEYSRVCIDSTDEDDIKAFTALNPAGRMPLGFPPLETQELAKIANWIEKGSKGPNTLGLEKNIREHKDFKERIDNWESFFNGPTLKQKLVARYLYEHLFLASIYFETNPDVYFRLVRSKTATDDIDEIGTSFPFDNPGKEFSYRLRPITNTHVHKSNIPFLFSDDRQEQWKREFLESPWPQQLQSLPAYGRAGSNPFVTFAAIPVKARYQFFLDNAGYHIMTFIKGPVCRGQTALNVINDHFWVLFMDPNQDALVNSPEAYTKVAQKIEFPSLTGDDLSHLVKFRQNYWDTVETKFRYMSSNQPLSVDSLWNGNKKDSNATITVYRHFDSASVLRGLRGGLPKTVWVLDYQVFESIYYNLSAGYNVFGPILHQLNSRLFMEVSRMASEDLFLSFLPTETRVPIRKSWNLPVPKKKESTLKWLGNLVIDDVEKKLNYEYAFAGKSMKSTVSLPQQNTITAFTQLLKDKHYSPEQYAPISDIDAVLSPLNQLPAQVVQHLPDTIMVKVDDEEEHHLWTLVHNRDHYNVTMIFFEDDRLRPEKDTLDVIRDAATSYANLIVVLKKNDVAAFVRDLQGSTTPAKVKAFFIKYGLSRTDPRFWEHYNEISRLSGEKLTNERGYIDLNRYMNL